MADGHESGQEAVTIENSPLLVNIEIRSPNTEIGELRFPGLLASTTVRQLKEKICEAIPSRPAHDRQRLIYRGRALARDNDILQDIFGVESVIHLVVRDLGELPSQMPGTIPPVHNAGPIPRPEDAQHPRTHFQGHTHQRFPHTQQNPFPAQPLPVNSGPLMPSSVIAIPANLPYMQPLTQQNPAMAQWIQQNTGTAQWVNNLRQDSVQRLYQQQLERAGGLQVDLGNPQDVTTQMNEWYRHAMAAQLVGHMTGINPPQLQADVAGGGISPAAEPYLFPELRVPSSRANRVAVSDPALVGLQGGQAGDRQTLQPSVYPGGRGGPTHSEMHSHMRGPDASRATQAMTDAMHRSASGTGLSTIANTPIPPGVTTSLFPSGSRHASRTSTPDLSGRTHGPRSWSVPPPTATLSQHSQPVLPQPEVYILSSPTGPRGLLVHSSSEMYITPSVRHTQVQTLQFNLPPYQQVQQPFQQQQEPMHRVALNFVQPFNMQQHNTVQGLRQRVEHRPVQVPLQTAVVQPQGQQVPVQPAQAAPPPAHANNPVAGMLLAAMWQHVWLVIRLAAFVWWFTSGDPSWTRWFTISAIAVAVFVVNLGVLDGFVNRALGPLRRHLEGLLLPLGDRNNQVQNANGNAARAQPVALAGVIGDPAAPAAAQRPEPDPAQAAARLLAQRREVNGHWLMEQIRRAERAGLLFLASIAPGVTEGHIAQIEARERAERQRQEATATTEAEAAAAAVAASITTATAAAAVESETVGSEHGTEAGGRPHEAQERATIDAGGSADGGDE